VEFGIILDPTSVPGAQELAAPSVRTGLLAAMPLLAESAFRMRGAAATGEVARDAALLLGGEEDMEGMDVAAGGGRGGRGGAKAAAAADFNDLDDLFGGGGAPAPAAKPSAAAAKPAASTADGLADLFGSASISAPAPAPTAMSSRSALTTALDDLYAGSASPALAPAAAAPVDLLGGMGGSISGGMAGTFRAPATGMMSAAAVATPPRVPASLADPFDLMGGASASASLGLGLSPASAPAPAPAASPASSGPLGYPPFVAFSSPLPHGLTVTFTVTKPAGTSSGLTDILATFTARGPGPLSAFICQVAVPKTMKLSLQPASSSIIPAVGAGSVTQAFSLDNAVHGSKAIAVRMKLVYTPGGGGETVTEQVDVKNFPAGV